MQFSSNWMINEQKRLVLHFQKQWKVNSGSRDEMIGNTMNIFSFRTRLLLTLSKCNHRNIQYLKIRVAHETPWSKKCQPTPAPPPSMRWAMKKLKRGVKWKVLPSGLQRSKNFFTPSTHSWVIAEIPKIKKPHRYFLLVFEIADRISRVRCQMKGLAPG